MIIIKVICNQFHVLYDAAAHYRKTPWRIPSYKDMEELIKRCKWEWTSLNKVDGYVVTGPNGNSIFLPAYGLKFNTFSSGVKSGLYWLSTNIHAERSMATNLIFNENGVVFGKQHKYCGLNIRPVV